MEPVMRLSEAIREGHKKLPRERWRSNDVCGCAIGMALIGGDGWTVERLREADSRDSPDDPYLRFKDLWLWLNDVTTPCPICGEELNGGAHLYHIFDGHIMNRYPKGSCSIVDLITYIEAIEPRDTGALVCQP